jgi:hypothetical protein
MCTRTFSITFLLFITALLMSVLSCSHQNKNHNNETIAALNQEIRAEVPRGSTKMAIYRFMSGHGFEDLSDTYTRRPRAILAHRVEPQTFIPLSRTSTDILFFLDAHDKLTQFRVDRHTLNL